MGADAALVADSKRVSAVEYLYADVSDANTILAAIDSGLLSRYQGKDRAAWQQVYREKDAELAKELAACRPRASPAATAGPSWPCRSR